MWCFYVYGARYMSEISSQCHGWAFPPRNCSVPNYSFRNTDSDNLGFIPKEPIPEKAGVYFASQVSQFPKAWQKHVLVLVAKLQKGKWWAFMYYQRIWKLESLTFKENSGFHFPEQCFWKISHKNKLFSVQSIYPGDTVSIYEPVCWSSSRPKVIFSRVLSVEQFCSVLNNVIQY